MSNKKSILIGIACVVVLIALGALLLRFRPALQKIDVKHDDSPPVEAVPQVMTRTIPSEDNSKYSIEVSYPELSGLASAGLRDKVNADIKAVVYNQVAGFRSRNASNLPLGEQEMKSSFNGDFEVALLTPSFFSTTMAYSDYSAGAAHPNNYLMAMNYNLKTGGAVTLDAFLRGLNSSAGFMDRLGQYVKTDLVRQLGNNAETLSVIDDGAAPTAENYATFTLDTQGLSIHFDPYQVASYAVGSPVVKIPYNDLMELIVKPAAQTAATTSVRWWLQ